MNVLDVEQRSKAWFDARLFCVTASRVADLKPLKNGGESADRRKYRYELAAEMIRKKSIDHFVSEAMQRGIDFEPMARTAYEMVTGVDVKQVGLVLHPTISRGAASPDGLVGPDGLVEFKVPLLLTHLGYLESGAIPDEYQRQMLWQMACCGPERKWCDFVSHCPELPSPYDTFIRRFDRDEKRIAEMEKEVLQFLAEVDETKARIDEMLGGESLTEFKLRRSIALVSKPQPVIEELEITEKDWK